MAEVGVLLLGGNMKVLFIERCSDCPYFRMKNGQAWCGNGCVSHITDHGIISPVCCLPDVNTENKSLKESDVDGTQAYPTEYEHPLFSVNSYDRDGDISSKGIFLHFGDVRIKVADSHRGFDAFVKYLETMSEEIIENY